ncbi:hypothetical protein K3495_g6815 [Podosphaera aphanis]|nr:hypothetical protein K3495_g6815 [Podosphaera aphanis]
MNSPASRSVYEPGTVPVKLDDNQTDATTNPLTLTLASGTSSSSPQKPQQTELQALNFIAGKCVEERNSDNGHLNQHPMANIPEHENEHVERATLQSAALTDYNATNNFINNSTIGLDMLAQFANPLNALDMLNSVDGLSNLTYFPHYGLQDVVDMPMQLNNPIEESTNLEASPMTQEPARVSAYAKLIFEDGFFYMNTYSVILGRDLQAWHAAMREEKRRQKRTLENGKQIRDPKTSAHIKHEGSRHSRSIVSESGGILRTGNDSDTEERARRRKLRKLGKASKKSKSTGSSAQNSRRNSILQQSKFKVYEAQNLQSTISHTDGPVPVDPAMLRPSPYDCPLVAIHPPASAPISAYKSISREHVKIAFNSKKRKFEAHVIGRNGCFVEDQWYHTGDVVPLESGDFLQIGGITVQFMLPNQLDPSTIVEYSDLSDEGQTLNTNSEVKKRPLKVKIKTRPKINQHLAVSGSPSQVLIDQTNSFNDDEMDEDEDQGEEKGNEVTEGAHSTRRLSLDDDDDEGDDGSTNIDPRIAFELKLGRKRGPGRPPKNGILSKREQKLLKKEDQALFEAMVKEGSTSTSGKEKEKGKGKDQELMLYSVSKLKDDTSGMLAKSFPEAFSESSVQRSSEKDCEQQAGLPTKNKVGRPRKHPLPDMPAGPPREKRKYTKRKPKESKEPKEGEANASGSGEESKAKKEKIPPRPPRSPSPVMNEEDFTPEQLAKPQSNYVTLIHEALSNAPTQQLGLPDIYRAIYRKYPYFKFKTQTLGWQSSVRHNLSQHHAFRKVEKDGKGWTWGIVDGISIEKEKKKRATPPPPSQLGQMHHQYGYQTGHPQIIGHFPYGPSSGYPITQMQNQEYSQYQSPPAHLQATRSNGLPPNFIHTIPPQLAAPNVSTSYSSPYAPKPAGPEAVTQPTGQSNLIKNDLSPSINGAEKQNIPAQIETSQQQANNLQTQNDPVQKASLFSTSEQQILPKSSPTFEKEPPQPSIPQGANTQSQNNTLSPPSVPQTMKSPSLAQSSSLNQSSAKGNIVPVANEDVMRAAETFKKTLLDSLKSKQSEMIVNSAINRVLGIATQTDQPGNPQEDMIMNALRSLLSKIPGSNIEAGNSQSISS